MVSHCALTAPYTNVLHLGNPDLFLYTAFSLLPEHSVLTDEQQATGRDGHKWITCSSGGERTRPKIWMGREKAVASSSTNNSVEFGLIIPQRPNGLYHCLSAQSQRKYFSLFLQNSGKHLCFNYMLHSVEVKHNFTDYARYEVIT